MRGMLAVVVFIALTVLSWGVYGPVLHVGQHAMGVTLPDGTQKDSLWLPFICVGLAYFVIAVVVPLVRLWSIGEAGRWSITGSVQSLAAGALGAVGALGIILAFNSGGSPIYVMPLVFGCAPVVKAYQEGREACEFWAGAHTLASGLRVPKSRSHRLRIEA